MDPLLPKPESRADGKLALPRATTCFSCEVRGSTEWCDVGDDDLRLLNQVKICNTYEPGQIVFYQGNPCLGLHCIESGTVALRKVDPYGNAVIARLFHEGQTMGYLAYFGHRGYTGTAEALTRCRVCFVDRSAVRTLLERDPRIGHRFLLRMADNLHDAEDARLRDFGIPLKARLGHTLLVLKERFGKSSEDGTLTVELPLSRRDLAAMLGARPESLSRAIRALEAAGIARFDGRRVEVPDLDALIDSVEVFGD